MKRLRPVRVLLVRYERDLLAITGVGCIGLGLATISLALALILVGGFLLFASGAGRRR